MSVLLLNIPAALSRSSQQVLMSRKSRAYASEKRMNDYGKTVPGKWEYVKAKDIGRKTVMLSLLSWKKPNIIPRRTSRKTWGTTG